MKNLCAVDGCDRPSRGRGWCQSHYCRWLRDGDPGSASFERAPKPRQACLIEGCDEVSRGHGLCKGHHQRLLDKGDPGTTPIRKKRPGETCNRDGCNGAIYAHYMCQTHYHQASFSVEYQAAHRAVRAARGGACEHSCVACGDPALEWAYQHTDPAPEFTPNGMPYSMSIEHYQPMCRPCHRSLDAAHRREAV